MKRENAVIQSTLAKTDSFRTGIKSSSKNNVRLIESNKGASKERHEPTLGARSIQPKFQTGRPGKEDHLKRWTRFFETFPVGPNRSIEFWTEISGKFG